MRIYIEYIEKRYFFYPLKKDEFKSNLIHCIEETLGDIWTQTGVSFSHRRKKG